MSCGRRARWRAALAVCFSGNSCRRRCRRGNGRDFLAASRVRAMLARSASSSESLRGVGSSPVVDLLRLSPAPGRPTAGRLRRSSGTDPDTRAVRLASAEDPGSAVAGTAVGAAAWSGAFSTCARRSCRSSSGYSASRSGVAIGVLFLELIHARLQLGDFGRAGCEIFAGQSQFGAQFSTTGAGSGPGLCAASSWIA